MAGDQLGADFFCHVNRNGEAQPAVHSVYQRVHPDHFAIDIAEWAAAVAGINRGVGLQVVRDGVAARLKQPAPPFAADHAVGKCVIEPEWRTDRKGELPNPHRVAIAELDDRQIFHRS